MSPETEGEVRRTRQDTDVRVRLRDRPFNAATAALGAGSEAARARLLEVDERSVRRARKGVIGEVFIARVLLAFRDKTEELAEIKMKPTFEEFFEVLAGGSGDE